MCPSVTTILLYYIDYNRIDVNVLLALSHETQQLTTASMNTVIVSIDNSFRNILLSVWFKLRIYSAQLPRPLLFFSLPAARDS